MKKLAVMLGLLLLASCYHLPKQQPELAYAPATPDDIASTPQDTIVFSLTRSFVVLQKVALTVPGQTPTPATSGSSSDACPVDSKDWTKCLPSIQPIVGSTAVFDPSKPDSDGNPIAYAYTAKLIRPTIPLANMSISDTPLTDNELLLKQVTFTYTDNTQAIIAGLGSGAVTGLTFGGPWGAAIGGMVGAAAAGEVGPETAGTTDNGWYKKVCGHEDDHSDQLTANLPGVKDIHLNVPTVVDIDSANFATPCWTMMRNTPEPGQSVDGQQLPSATVNGWLYRTIDDATATPAEGQADSVLRTSFFSAPSTPMKQFPVSSCRPVRFEITWWQALKDAKDVDNPTRRSYPIIVADPEAITPVVIPKGGTINFRTICGGYASPTYMNSPIPADYTALVAAAQNFQKEYATLYSGRTTSSGGK